MMNRELQIVCYGPSAGAGRGYIMGPPVVVDAAHRSNEANFTGPHGRLGPSTGSLAWLWARTETHAHPTAPNEPNFQTRRAAPHTANGARMAPNEPNPVAGHAANGSAILTNEPNFRVFDAGTRVVMRNQGKRRAWCALRDGRRNAGSRKCQTNPIRWLAMRRTGHGWRQTKPIGPLATL